MHFSNVLTLALAACVAAAPQGPCPGAIGGCLTIRANGPPGLLGGGSAGTGSIGALSPIPASTTTASAIASCGDNTQLSCCNKADTSGSSANVASGILSGLLPNLVGGGQDGLGLFDQCSKISVTGLIGVADLLNSQCKQIAACCQNSPSTQTGGLVNAGLPCIAFGSLL